MTHTHNELSELFPDKAARIHALKTENHHFARLADDYHHVNRQIHRAEVEIEPMDDAHLEELKKRRLKLLDEIRTLLG